MSIMMSRSKCGLIWIAALLVLAVQGVKGEESGVTCSRAMFTGLIPCQSFLVGKSTLNVPCCQGVVTLSRLIGSDKSQIKSLCNCLKPAAANMGVIPNRVTQLRQTCGVDFPVPIDPNVNCNSL